MCLFYFLIEAKIFTDNKWLNRAKYVDVPQGAPT